jgi:Cu(I)/Ag(I) efflux system membrane fusion protein
MMNAGRRKMRKYIVVAAGAVVALLAILYFSKSGPFAVVEPKPALAQTHQHGGAPAKQPETAQGSMPGMPGMPAEKSPVQEAKPSPTEGQQAEAPTIEIPKDKQQLIGVRTATARVQPLTKDIRTVGLIEYDQRRLNTINTKVEGWVEKLYINFTGTYVKKGQPIADIYSPELWATQQEFINMVRWAKRSQAHPKTTASDGPDIGAMIDKDALTLVDSARQRLKLWDISDAQIRKIEESEKPIRTLTVYSPYSGYVLQKYVNQGQRIMPGEKLFDIADLSSVWITADIYEFELPLVKVGDPALVQLSYFPGKQFNTRIDYIYPVLEGETRTAKARFTIPNQGGLLKPQMFTNVDLMIGLGRKLAVPNDAVINTGVRKVAYVDNGDGNFEPREVVTGVQTEKLVEVTAGLKPGDKVASSANFLIDSEAKLKGVEPLPRGQTTGSQGSQAPSRSAAPQHTH